jgi:hypothetical protein
MLRHLPELAPSLIEVCQLPLGTGALGINERFSALVDITRDDLVRIEVEQPLVLAFALGELFRIP